MARFRTAKVSAITDLMDRIDRDPVFEKRLPRGRPEPFRDWIQQGPEADTRRAVLHARYRQLLQARRRELLQGIGS